MSTDAATAVLVTLRAHAQGLHEAVETASTDAPGTAVVLRDASSRMAALLDSYREVLDPARTAPVAVDLRRLASTAGRVRDAEALETLLAEILAAVPRALVVGPVGDRIRHHVRDRRSRAADALAKAVRDEACLSALASVDRIVITPPLLAPEPMAGRAVVERAAVERRPEGEPDEHEDRHEAEHKAEKAGKAKHKKAKDKAKQDKAKHKAEHKAEKAEHKAEKAKHEDDKAEHEAEKAERKADARVEAAAAEESRTRDGAAAVLARAADGDDARLAGVAAALRAGSGEGDRERVWPEVREAAVALSGSAGAARSEHGKKARRLAEAADAVAARTDEVVDSVLARRLLVDLADQAHRHREPGFTYGLLHAEAGHRGAVATGRASAALDEVTRDKLRSWMPGH